MKDSIEYRIRDLQPIPVVPRADSLRFIISVPEFKGEPPINPVTHEGLSSWDGKALEGLGFVFYNHKDEAYQFIEGTGDKVIILNGMSLKDQATLLDLTEDLYKSPSLDKMKTLYGQLKRYCDSLGKILDIYNSDWEYVNKNMVPAEVISRDNHGFRVRKRDMVKSWYLPGKQSLQGPAASAQQYEKGAFVVCHADEYRAIHPEAFVEAYQKLTGEPISQNDYNQSDAVSATRI